MKLLSGKYSLIDAKYSSDSQGIVIGEVGSLRFEVSGQMIVGREVNNFPALAELYAQHGEQMTAHLGGTYQALIYDAAAQRLVLLHDRMTSPLALYYTVFDNILYFANSLRVLLRNTKIKRQLSAKAVADFLLNGFLAGEQTLLLGISKLSANQALVVADGQVQTVPVSYPVPSMTAGEALSSWRETLDNAIKDCLAGEIEVNMPISSGYDSSYILHVAAQSNLPLHLFSIGGAAGKSELPAVRANVEHYAPSSLHTSLTSNATLQQFPDLVWRLEGTVYEVGIFLQYELAKLVQQAKKTFLICGECADQVMHEAFQTSAAYQLPATAATPIHYTFSEYPYIYGSQLILKKNGILCNSFGIDTRYPYLDERVVAISMALAKINGKDKRCQVANCKECLPKEVVANLAKVGGATEVISLFANEQERKQLCHWVENSQLYQKYEHIIKKYSYVTQQQEKGWRKIKTVVRNSIMVTLRVGTETRKKNQQFMQEMKMREYLQILYLIIFEKLFVTENYDLNNEGCSLTLKQLMKK